MKKTKNSSKKVGRPSLGDKALSHPITLKFDSIKDKELRAEAKDIGLGITQYLRMLIFKARKKGQGK